MPLTAVFSDRLSQDAALLNKMGILCGDMRDFEKESKFYGASAGAAQWSAPLFNLALSQVKDFLGLVTPKLPADFFSLFGVLGAHLHTINLTALAIAAASLALVVLWPKSYSMPTAPVGLVAKSRRLAAHVPGTVVVLHHYLDLPLERVAEIIGIPTGTAHSRLHHAMRGLRAALDADARPPMREVAR